jgi:hypothetical protein
MSDEPRDPLTPAEDQWLDRMLDAPAPVLPSASVRRAVAEIPLRHPRAASSRAFGLPAYAIRFALFAALASAAVGAWLGSQAEVLPELAIGEDVQTDDEAWDELSLLAFADDLDAELQP